jgi:hypothetical protein
MGDNRSINQSGSVIPQDWQLTDDTWCKVTFCIPSSRSWLVTVLSLIDLLGQGRYWRSDGPRKAQNPLAIEIRDVKAIAELIKESVCVSCNYESLEQQKIDQLKELVKAVKQLQKDTAANNDCLVATQKAINQILGGADPGDCADSSVPADCQPVAGVVDELINTLDWLVWGVETIGGTLAAPIVDALCGFRWFTAILVVAGLVEPSPAEEVVTVPLGVVAILTAVVEKAIQAGANFARQAVNELKANRNAIVDELCGATNTDIETKIDNVINMVKNTFTDTATKQLIQDMLENLFKNPITQGVILTK